MKTLEEIEKLSPEELEAQAAAQGVHAPQDLQQRLRETLAARELAQTARPRPARWIPYASLAVAAAAAALVLLPPSGPKDTFDDPLLAYAQTEEVLRMISDKMAQGIEMAGEARATAGKTMQIFNRTNEK